MRRAKAGRSQRCWPGLKRGQYVNPETEEERKALEEEDRRLFDLDEADRRLAVGRWLTTEEVRRHLAELEERHERVGA